MVTADSDLEPNSRNRVEHVRRGDTSSLPGVRVHEGPRLWIVLAWVLGIDAACHVLDTSNIYTHTHHTTS